MLKHDRRCTEMSKKKDIATALLGILMALILWLTVLSREKLIGTSIVYTPFHEILSMWKSIQRGGITGNFLGNIALFVPVGVLFPLVSGKQKLLWTVGVGFGFSLFIEIIQLITARGCFDPDDIILNTLGAAIGYGLYRAIVYKKTIDAENS